MSSIESHLSNKPKQVFFNPINTFDTFTHSITLLYIFNKLFSFNVNFLIYSYPDNLQRQGGYPNGAGPPPQPSGKEAAFPLYGNAVDKAMNAADGGPPPMPSGLTLPPPPGGAGAFKIEKLKM